MWRPWATAQFAPSPLNPALHQTDALRCPLAYECGQRNKMVRTKTCLVFVFVADQKLIDRRETLTSSPIRAYEGVQIAVLLF